MEVFNMNFVVSGGSMVAASTTGILETGTLSFQPCRGFSIPFECDCEA